MIPPILLRFLPHALILLALIGGVTYYGHQREAEGRATVKAEWDEQRADQTAAALGALRGALERDAAERKAQEDRRIAAGETLLGAVNTIRARVGAINQKLEESRNADPACAAWLDTPVSCPLPWRMPDDAHPGANNDSGARADDVHPSAGIVPAADLAGGTGAADEWVAAPVRGRIARAD